MLDFDLDPTDCTLDAANSIFPTRSFYAGAVSMTILLIYENGPSAGQTYTHHSRFSTNLTSICPTVEGEFSTTDSATVDDTKKDHWANAMTRCTKEHRGLWWNANDPATSWLRTSTFESSDAFPEWIVTPRPGHTFLVQQVFIDGFAAPVPEFDPQRDLQDILTDLLPRSSAVVRLQ